MDKKFGKSWSTNPHRRNGEVASHFEAGSSQVMAIDLQMERESLAADGMPLAVDRMPMAADEGVFTPAPFKEGVKKATGLKPRSISKGKRYRIWKRDGGPSGGSHCSSGPWGRM